MKDPSPPQAFHRFNANDLRKNYSDYSCLVRLSSFSDNDFNVRFQPAPAFAESGNDANASSRFSEVTASLVSDLSHR
jgi:hypothetical protein